MNRKLLPGKYSFVTILTLGALTMIVNSSFTKSGSACGGTFQTTNQFGNSFAILSPATGAPDNANGTCYGCHKTYANNSGPGTFTVSVGGGITQYVPGTTYTVTVTMQQTSIIAMDFEATTRDQSGNAVPSGSFTITDAQRTRLSNGNFGGSGTGYVEGTACGVDVISTGYNQWSFNWNAPLNANGNVTFYVAGVAANFNNQNTFDYTYSKTVVLTAATGIKDQDKLAGLKLFPNPANGKFSLEYNLQKESSVTVKLFSLQGKEVAALSSSTESPGAHTQQFDLEGRYAPGVYLLDVLVGEEQGTFKVIIY